MRLLRAFAALLLVSLAVPAQAQEEGEQPPAEEKPKNKVHPDDIDEGKDHPLLKRFPKSWITNYEHRDFQEHDLQVAHAPGADDEFKKQKVEGAFTHISYENDKKASTTEVYRNYKNALQKAGFKQLFEQSDGEIKTYRSSFELARGKGKTWVQIEVRPHNEWSATDLWIVESKGMEQKIEVDASALLEELNKSGHVAVYGINFDTGKASIKKDSAKVLEQIVKLLQDNADLKLKIEGHTDNVGKAKANEELSKKRAEAVRDWLAKHGVDKARLQTAGLGDKKPVADNSTEEGKAKNRRVELVKL